MSAKKTKLTEKATRIADTRQEHWDDTITQYLKELEQIHSESARSHRFTALLQKLLGVEPQFIENYSSGIEKYISTREKDRIQKGRVDNLFGNVIIEFERNLTKTRDEAKEQLKRYMAILWSLESSLKRTPYLCIATDGVRFVSYTPSIENLDATEITSENVRLHVLEDLDWRKLKSDEIFFWLDRYFLRKEVLHPTSELMVRDFGLNSHAFQTSTKTLLSLWKNIKSESQFEVIYQSWEKYLRIVYGSQVTEHGLFVSHTYLATLAKIMSWMRLTERTDLPGESEIMKLLEGRLFKEQGIENYIEEDFFSWLAREEAVEKGIGIVRWLFSLLKNYNLRELSEDILKSLYQELVDPATRHDLGEFYTPDWLAHRMIKKLMAINPEGKMLDPACGSGTFLYLAIREKRDALGDSRESLSHITQSVDGADIHPLAVIVAKTNYILALGDLIKKRRKPVNIPIYLADTIRLPEKWSPSEDADYEVSLNNRHIFLPALLMKDISAYDRAIELAKEFAYQNRGQKIALQNFKNFLNAQHFSFPKLDKILNSLFSITQALKDFIENERDTIWAFVLKNFYKPLFFKQKFDFIIGNPPWISFRYLEPSYQAVLKKLITKEYKLLSGRGELITHLEIATLFLVRTADLYLKAGGTIAFVMPRSLFSADQHDGLRNRIFSFKEDKFRTLTWNEIWDCQGITPLFNVPSCVMIADKIKATEFEKRKSEKISGKIFRGKLSGKNASLAEAEETIEIENEDYILHASGKRTFWAPEGDLLAKGPSFYKDYFYQGTSIVPRSFWFVQVTPSPLGFNPGLPRLETADRARREAKDPYKTVYFNATVESRFLYATLLSTDLLPFGHLDYRLVVLPIEPEGNKYKLIDRGAAQRRGFLRLAQWLEKVESEWIKRRSSKAERITSLEWLD